LGQAIQRHLFCEWFVFLGCLLCVESFGEPHNISKEDLGRDENTLLVVFVLPLTVPRLSGGITASSPNKFIGANDHAPNPKAVLVPHDRMRVRVARVVVEVLDMKMIWLQCGFAH
jgi:hypothetical protein